MRTFVVAAFALLCVHALPGQTLTADQISSLLARIDQLEKRVSELEAEKAQGKSPAMTAAATPAVAAHGGHAHLAPSLADAANPEVAQPTLRLSGFTDVNFAASDSKGSKSGFQEGQFILHVTSALSPKVSYFGELSFTARPDGGLGSPPVTGFNMEVERSIIRYEQDDKFKLSFGRYHTPINFWNTAYHHGSWLHTSVARPAMAQFGGAFLPVHFVGALAEGSIPANSNARRRLRRHQQQSRMAVQRFRAPGRDVLLTDGGFSVSRQDQHSGRSARARMDPLFPYRAGEGRPRDHL
jgi:hypothetical protein